MIKKEVISFSLDSSLIAKLRRIGNGNLSDFVNRLLRDTIDSKEQSLVERMDKLEKKMESILKLLGQQGVEL